MADLVKFPDKPKAHNDEIKERADFVETARIIGRLALLDLVAYERRRLAKAKEIGCRASFLDKTVERVREALLKFEEYGLIGEVTRNDDVRSVRLEDAPAWMLAIDKSDKQARCLVLLADGSLEVKKGWRKEAAEE